jgi:class I fructose-bisphosphate aldolase
LFIEEFIIGLLLIIVIIKVKMVSKNLGRIMRRGRAMFLAYDQGLEHGPDSDFDDRNVDPLFIINIAKKGGYTGVVFHKGIAERYGEEIEKSGVPLIIKLNGRTGLRKGEPISKPVCSVEEAKALGAVAVGYTLYIGSALEGEMFEDFDEIENDARKLGLPVITWIYPRGKAVKNDVSRKMISYAARTGLELGADIVKLKYGGNRGDLKWAVESAGRTKVVVAGGVKKGDKKFLEQVREIMDAGCVGLAVGRNVWQNEDPLKISEEIRKIIFGRSKLKDSKKVKVGKRRDKKIK